MSASTKRVQAALTPAQRRFARSLLSAVAALETERSRTQSWPDPQKHLPEAWVLRRNRTYVNYLGEAEQLRWLLLFIEPDPAAPADTSPPDHEHHLLNDGTLVHFTLWTQPAQEPTSEEVSAFPAAEGWVEVPQP